MSATVLLKDPRGRDGKMLFVRRNVTKRDEDDNRI
jgi:hypothetical protein